MVTASFVVDTTEIATQIAEAIAGIGSIVAGMKNVELARKYYDLYKQQRDFYYSVFQQGVEIPLISEVYNTPYYYKDYAARVNTLYNADTGPFGGESGDITGWWIRHANMYGQDKDGMIGELEADEARIRSDWTNYLFRFEELWADVRNDQRWANRLTVHNIGLKQGAQVATNLQTSLEKFQDNISDLSSQLATYGNGIAQYAGYKRGLQDTSNQFNTGTSFAPVTMPFNSLPNNLNYDTYRSQDTRVA